MKLKYENNKPRKGDRLSYRGAPEGTVTRLDGDICHYEKESGESTLFIWRFAEGLNELYEWPDKWKTPLLISPCPSKIANSRAG